MTYTASVNQNAADGHILRSHASLTSSNTGINQSLAEASVLVGRLINFPPAAAVITSPADGAGFLVGGADDDPAPPDSAFSVEWTSATDPEDDALTYIWQLSVDDSFSDPIVDEASAEAGSATFYETDFGTLAALLDENGIQLGESLTLYHRVVASDGANTTPSEVFSIVLTRGTIVSAEADARPPLAYALHTSHPNPVRSSTTFAFDLPTTVHVSLTVYDVVGRSVSTIVSRRLPAGSFEYHWEPGPLPSGIYLYRLQAGPYTATKKLVLLR